MFIVSALVSFAFATSPAETKGRSTTEITKGIQRLTERYSDIVSRIPNEFGSLWNMKKRCFIQLNRHVPNFYVCNMLITRFIIELSVEGGEVASGPVALRRLPELEGRLMVDHSYGMWGTHAEVEQSLRVYTGNRLRMFDDFEAVYATLNLGLNASSSSSSSSSSLNGALSDGKYRSIWKFFVEKYNWELPTMTNYSSLIWLGFIKREHALVLMEDQQILNMAPHLFAVLNMFHSLVHNSGFWAKIYRTRHVQTIQQHIKYISIDLVVIAVAKVSADNLVSAPLRAEVARVFLTDITMIQLEEAKRVLAPKARDLILSLYALGDLSAVVREIKALLEADPSGLAIPEPLAYPTSSQVTPPLRFHDMVQPVPIMLPAPTLTPFDALLAVAETERHVVHPEKKQRID